MGSDAPSYTMVKKGVARFKAGISDTKDVTRVGASDVPTTPTTVSKIERIVMRDRRVGLKNVAETGISKERANHIIHT